jgi:hypothetical protein
MTELTISIEELINSIEEQIELNKKIIFKIGSTPRDSTHYERRHDADYYRGQNKAYKLVLTKLK